MLRIPHVLLSFRTALPALFVAKYKRIWDSNLVPTGEKALTFRNVFQIIVSGTVDIAVDREFTRWTNLEHLFNL